MVGIGVGIRVKLAVVLDERAPAVGGIHRGSYGIHRMHRVDGLP